MPRPELAARLRHQWETQMILPLLLGSVACCLGVGLIYGRWRCADFDSVSPAWLVTNEWRELQRGYEGVSIRFPIQKLQNEHAAWQTRRLRRQACEAFGQREKVRTRLHGRESATARAAVMVPGRLRDGEESVGRDQA